MDDHKVLGIIDEFWRHRLAGDKAAVVSSLSPGATYELVGANAFADPVAVGPTADAVRAAHKLIDDFRFHGMTQLAAVVEGRKAAVVSKVEVSFRGGSPVTTEICDFWEFDDKGKVQSLKQFVDTHLLHGMLHGAS